MLRPPERPDAAPLQLGEHLAVLRVRKWWLVGVAAVTVVTALGLSLLQNKVYTSSAEVLVRSIPAVAGGQPEDPNMTTEQQLAKSAQVATIAAQTLAFTGPLETLLEPLAVDVVSDTEILRFGYSSGTPQEAALRAQALADAYLRFRHDQVVAESQASASDLRARIDGLNKSLRAVIAAQAAATGEASRTSLQAERDGLASQIGLLSAQVAQVEGARDARVGQVVQPADQPREPSSPKPARNGILALIVGLALGVGAAFFAERLDDRFRGPEGLEISAGAPVLSVIPRMPAERTADGMLVTIRHPDSAHAEAYRTLRTGLMFAASGRSARTMVVTSPLAGDGKTVTTANLGIAIAQAGKRVVLVSADLRKPDLHRLFGWENGPGLTDVLSKRANVWELLVRPEGIDNLWVLQSGSGLGTPADLLSSHEMAELLTQLRDSADVVLIDTGPVLAVPDALSLGPLVDGMLIVVSADQTTRGAVRQARRQLELVNARILGAVLNNFRARKRSGYYHEYGPSRRDAATPAAPSEGTNP